jgi:hypothetical protein
MVRVTQKHIDMANAKWACHVPQIGTPICELPGEDLDWFSIKYPEEAANLAKEVSLPVCVFGSLDLWLLGYGYGDGDGYGYGSGSGDGFGYGSGYGDGSWYGDGDGLEEVSDVP